MRSRLSATGLVSSSCTSGSTCLFFSFSGSLCCCNWSEMHTRQMRPTKNWTYCRNPRSRTTTCLRKP
uniref:Putative secreted protein n=1 Tax=Ixodes ricinus TaxID=34613 RepID=A0A6B0TSK0_IXORI